MKESREDVINDLKRLHEKRFRRKITVRETRMWDMMPTTRLILLREGYEKAIKD